MSCEPAFSPIECAFKAIELKNITAVALTGDHCAVVATQKLSFGKYLVPETTSNLFTLDESIGSCVVGSMADAQHQMDLANDIAHKFKLDFGYQIPLDVLCHRVVNISQVCSQNAVVRELGCGMIMIAYDDVTGPTVYMTNPSANCSVFKACAEGPHSAKATKFLEEKFRSNLSEDSAIQLAIGCLSHIRCNGNQPETETIEVGVVSQCEPNFRILSVSEIEYPSQCRLGVRLLICNL